MMLGAGRGPLAGTLGLTLGCVAEAGLIAGLVGPALAMVWASRKRRAGMTVEHDVGEPAKKA